MIWMICMVVLSVLQVHGQINGGGKLLSLKTGDGSIRLEKH